MKKPVQLIRQVIIALIGFPLLLIGIILIPLPGPGVLVCLLGLVVLSLEFDWAQKYRDNAANTIKKIYEQSKTRANDTKKK